MELLMTVFRKQTHTDRWYLHFNSYHPVRAVFLKEPGMLLYRRRTCGREHVYFTATFKLNVFSVFMPSPLL
jgi:hypothetical protein